MCLCMYTFVYKQTYKVNLNGKQVFAAAKQGTDSGRAYISKMEKNLESRIS